MTKYLMLENIIKSDTTKSLNYSQSRAKAKGIYDQLGQLQGGHTNIIC